MTKSSDATISTLQGAAARATEKHLQAKRTVQKERDALKGYEDRLEAAQEVQALLQAVAAAVQTKAHASITAVVSRCLQTVFPELGYAFRINFTRKRGKTEAEMVFLREGIEISPVEEDSGGVTQVAAFALRLACLLLATPKKRRLLILDEPFNAVSEDYIGNVATLLESLASDLSVQFILCTHNPQLEVGKVIHMDD